MKFKMIFLIMNDWSQFFIDEDNKSEKTDNINKQLKKKIYFINKNSYLYQNEDKKIQRKRFDQILKLYKKSKPYFIDQIYLKNLYGNFLLKNDIQGQLNQEEYIIDLYELVYEKKISKSNLEKIFLGRKCVSIYQKIKDKIGFYRILRVYHQHFTKNDDPYSLFMRNNTIHGYTNRLYWNEKLNEYKTYGVLNNYYSKLPIKI